jgi:hypothetical protein
VYPDLVRTTWTEQEDENVLRCLEEIGPKWFLIAASLPGRGKNSVKNRYFTLRRREVSGCDPSARCSTFAEVGREGRSHDVEELKNPGMDLFGLMDGQGEDDGVEWTRGSPRSYL